MSTIYVIKEKIQLFSNESKIIGAVSDEKLAKKYCRDMRTGRDLYYEAVELDAQEMTDIISTDNKELNRRLKRYNKKNKG